MKTIRMRMLVTAVAVLTAPFHGMSQDIRVDDALFRWEGGVSAGLDNDGYGVDLRGLYFLSPYFGVKLGIGYAGELQPLSEWSDDSVWDYPYYSGHTYAWRFKLNPALSLRSPALLRRDDRDMSLHMFAEPGVVFSPGSSGSRNARTWCWDVKAGLNLQIDRYVLTLGYGISDFSLYSGSPHNYWGMPGKTDYLTHTVFIGAAVKFNFSAPKKRVAVPDPFMVR